MASNIHFEYDQHQVSLEKLKLLVSDPVLLNTLDHIVELAEGELGRAVCPAHGKSPQIMVMVTSSGELNVHTTSCCDLFARTTTEHLQTSFYHTAYFQPHMKLIVQVQDEISALPYVFTADSIQTLLIGRSDADVDERPDIDLQQYGAVEKGVSRRHASIQWHHGALHVVDEGSSNGTYVNGERLEAHEPFVLHDGDCIQLGRLAVQVMLMQSEN